MSIDRWKQNFSDSYTATKKITDDDIFLAQCEKFSLAVTETYQNEGNVFVAGNGGSHCEALHFAEEMTGRFKKNRRPLGAVALGESTHLTCVANDFGFEEVFARQLEGLGRKGDLFIALSTSGNSRNLIKAAQIARKKGIRSVALLGRDGGELKSLVDVPVVVPLQLIERIQEVHLQIIHTAIEICERVIFPENYEMDPSNHTHPASLKTL